MVRRSNGEVPKKRTGADDLKRVRKSSKKSQLEYVMGIEETSRKTSDGCQL
jgi:hypothetical protein